MDRGELTEIALREKEKRLTMNRVPKKTKDTFLELSESEFEGDYGLTFKAILDGYLMWRIYFDNMDMKLDRIQDSINQLNTEQEPESTVPTMLSGKKRRIE